MEPAQQMANPERVVSLHPYFKVHPGKIKEAKDLLRKMVAQTLPESANLYYDFTINGDVVFCREAYLGAEGLLAHVENIGPLLAEFLKIGELFRIQVHGAKDELEKLKGPLGDLKPEWFTFECGVVR